MRIQHLHPLLFLLATLILFLPFVSPELQEYRGEFVRALREAFSKGKFRFRYEVNLFDGKKVKSVFFDEAYSRATQQGRILMNHGILPDHFAYSMFFWRLSQQHHESHWLRPFVCSTSRVGLDYGLIPSGLFRPQELASLASYSEPGQSDLSFQGLAAFLLNVLGDASQKQETHQYAIPGSDLTHLDWTMTLAAYRIEISIQILASSASIGEHDFNSIVVEISKSKDGSDDVQLVAAFTVLSFSQNFDDRLVQLPSGYSCSHSAHPQTKIPNNKLTSSPRTKYTYEVSVTRSASISNQTSRLLSNHYSDSAPEPSDSLINPETQSRSFELLLDELDGIIAIVSSRSKSGSVLRSARREEDSVPTLTVWDFFTRKRHQVNLESGRCESPHSFVSSLFGGDERAKHGGSFTSRCSSESVEVNLGGKLKLRLNEDGLKLLTFTFQDRTNYMQLIDLQESPSGQIEYVYERSAFERFCLFDDSSGLISYPVLRLVSRFSQKSTGDPAVVEPKGMSLLFYDQTQAQLMLQVDLDLLHYEPYEPWAGSRHMLDMSSCKRGYRESAQVSIEYPLTGDSEHLRDVLEPRQAIREALATNLRLAFGLSLLRLPSIEVEIMNDLVLVKLQLLDRASLLSESTLLEVTARSNADEFLNQLELATRSVLAESLDRCADYCQLYECAIFAYCSQVKECYIYTDPSVLASGSFGSYLSLGLSCDAYEVPAERLSSADEWRKKSWSLDDIVVSLTDSIAAPEQTFAGPTRVDDLKARDRSRSSQQSDLVSISFLAPIGSSKLSRSIRLVPDYAEYHYDNLHSSAFASDTMSDPFDMSTPSRATNESMVLGHHRSPYEMANNFKIIMIGHKLIDRSPIQIHRHRSTDLESLQIEASPASHLLLEDQTLDDCLRLCLNDLSCTLLSHCNDPRPTCTLTNLELGALEELKGQQESTVLVTELRLDKDPRCSIMQRTYSDQFRLMETRMLMAHGGRSVSETLRVFKSEDVDDCAGECVSSRAASLATSTGKNATEASCLSFDFCQPVGSDRSKRLASVCILFKDHLVSNVPARVKGDHRSVRPNGHSSDGSNLSLMELLQSPELGMSVDSYCRHHVRNQLASFHRIGQRRLPDSVKALTLRNYIDKGEGSEDKGGVDLVPEQIDDGEAHEDISLARCASLCEESPSCGSFEYCTAKHNGAPHNLYLSCSLSNDLGHNEDKAERTSDRQPLVKSQVCAVYTYKSLSLILRHKKRQLASLLSGQLQGEISQVQEASSWNVVGLDGVILVAFFVLGLLVRDLNTSQFSFRRMRTASGERNSPTGSCISHNSPDSRNHILLRSLRGPSR